jgi:hypothetical protein
MFERMWPMATSSRLTRGCVRGTRDVRSERHAISADGAYLCTTFLVGTAVQMSAREMLG